MSLRVPQMKNQLYVFPELLEEKVENGPHAARFYLYLAGILNLDLYKKEIMGTIPYSRSTLIAVILYSMHEGYFSPKGIVKYAKDSIGVHWILNGMKMPSYKTVERTILALLDEIDSFFTQILSICEELSLIGKKRMYTDGVKIKANASKHKAMSYGHLTKKIKSGGNEIELLFTELKNSIDGFEDLTNEEMEKLITKEAEKVHGILQKNHQKALDIREKQIFNMDLNEPVEENEIDYDELNTKSEILKNTSQEKYEETVETLNNIAFIKKKVERMEDAKTKLESKWEKENGDKKIPEKKQINFTDSDSCIMVTKHHGVQQCYNHFALVDDKAHIILGTHTSNNSSDQLGLVPTIENTEELYGSLEGFQLGADAGFFSANNILYTEGRGINFYASYPQANSPYAKDKFKYDNSTDTYTCPEGNILTMQKQLKDEKTQLYSNENACVHCPNSSTCTKAKDGIRRIERYMENDRIREDAKEKANSKEGREILRLRKSIPEPVWGNIQTQDGLTQMHYRGLGKASLEFRLHSAMHNIRKIVKVYFHSRSYQEIIHSSEWIYPQTG
jgi:transposase